ncbi:MAG: NADH-quinone oxidoreductase subunit A [Planctomycetota bacterium]|nr:NADH-quinone oxidoreductase subunit A [Planctomycetota bacterium]MDA1105459.1 NADH-quinone oxidoreductase subunit A [Planctomycetota bacterium]
MVSHVLPLASIQPVVLLAADSLQSYAPVALVVVMVIGFCAINIIASMLIGPSTEGTVKAIAYESGMNPWDSARKRFNVRFYIMAMTFLVFDVEIIFLYPWAVAFADLEPGSAEAKLYLARMAFFVGTSVVAYIYAWKKGVFRWD